MSTDNQNTQTQATLLMGKLRPAKRLNVSGKVSTYPVQCDPFEFYVPSLSEIKEHLGKKAAFALADGEEAQKYTEDTGLPAYSDDFSNWIQSSVFAAARTKANSAITISGTTPEELSAEITGNLPLSRDDLLSSERAGGPYMKQKASFLKAFASWAEGNLSKSGRFIKALGAPNITATPQKAWPMISEALEAFVKANPEMEAEHAVYLRSVRKQLNAEDAADDWDDVPE